MNEYDMIKELLSRYHAGKADLSDEDAELLAMKAQRFGERFTPESKPFSKGFFDMADMATFGLLPDEWRPYSPGQDIFGETTADKFAGTIGSIGGMIGGATAATKGAKMGWNAIKKAFAKKKADNIATNIYGGNLLGPGPNVPRLGQGSPLSLPGRPGVPQLPGRPFTPGGAYYGTNPAQITPKGMRDIGYNPTSKQLRRMDAWDEKQLRSLDTFADPYGTGWYAQSPKTSAYGADFGDLSIGEKLGYSGIQQGGYIPGYQEGGMPDAWQVDAETIDEQTDDSDYFRSLSRQENLNTGERSFDLMEERDGVPYEDFATVEPGGGYQYESYREPQNKPGLMAGIQRALPWGQSGKTDAYEYSEGNVADPAPERMGEDLKQYLGYRRGGYVKGR